MNFIIPQKGVTLLETMFVLAIAASLLILSLKVYNQFQFQAYEQKILANVNQLFQGAQGYYYANCRQILDKDSVAMTSGALDPLVAKDSTTQILSVTDDLVDAGFISQAQWQPNNPLVATNGYFVQFNRLQPDGVDPVMNVRVCTGNEQSPQTSGCNTVNLTPLPSSKVYIWITQVAVQLASSLKPDQWTRIKNDLGATCISGSGRGGVNPCAKNPTANGYLVWTRPPSGYHPNINSANWIAMPALTLFNMQYTNDGMATLSNVKNETQSPSTRKNWYNPLNYLCGG